MNARDSEKLVGILEQAGYEKSDSEEADFVLYNTCTVRENANLRVYGRLGHLNRLKKKNPHMRIALCGCMMQEAHVVEKIKKSYSFVDLIFGTHNLYKFPELLANMLASDRMIIDIWEGTDQIVEDLPRTGNIRLSRESISCLAATTFAVTALSPMCEDEREAESLRRSSGR